MTSHRKLLEALISFRTSAIFWQRKALGIPCDLPAARATSSKLTRKEYPQFTPRTKKKKGKNK